MTFAGKRAMWCLIVALAAVLLLALAVRPMRITDDYGSKNIWLFAWQQGRVEFINSITRKPVEISFKMPWHFSGFSARTDPGTEEYYTAGRYSWNEQLAKEETRTLQYCSEVGMTVTLGGNVFQEKGGCLTVDLLWPR